MKKRNITLFVVLGIVALAMLMGVLVLMGMNKNALMIRYQSEHVVYYSHKSNETQAREMSAYIESAYGRAAACLGMSSPPQIKVIIHPTQAQYDNALEKAAVEVSQYAFLSRETVHIAPLNDVSEAALEAASYQTVRCLLRMLTDRNANGILTDSLAAWAAQDTPFAELREGAPAARGKALSELTSEQGIERYEDFIAQADYQARELYAIFLVEEGQDPEAVGSLWRVIRAREPVNFERATGYDEAIWTQAWQKWLEDFKPYDLNSFLPDKE